MEWMSAREGAKTQHISVQTNFIQQDNGEISTKMQLVPSTGTHFFNYKGKWIRAERTREKNVVDMTSGNLWETITLTTLGRNRGVFEQILEEAKDFALQKEEGTTVIYTSAGGDWRRFGFPRKRRPLESVILEQGRSDKLLTDAKEFLNSARWYIDRGTSCIHFRCQL
jgi:chaperone BCS1